jgi:hypothetical protein
MFAGIVPVCGSSSIERVTLCDGSGKLTVYSEGSNDIWTEANQTEELYSQFFQESLH